MGKLCITGADGFVAKKLAFKIAKTKDVQLIGRRKNVNTSDYFFADIDSKTRYNGVLDNVDVLIHCAARVHVMGESESRHLALYREVNSQGTINLAEQAVNAGVKRFIFISTIKVNGESTYRGTPFIYNDQPQPSDPYSISKAEAEVALRNLSNESGMEVVIIRPPLVFGPDVKANFAALMNLVNKGLPLPFGVINSNKRSMVYVENLVDLIFNCIDNPKAANQTFMVSDDNDLSTRELITHMGNALGKKNIQMPIPVWCYRLLGKLSGKSETIERLVGSLQVDIQHTKDTLSWTPPFTVEQGMAATAKAFLKEKRK